LPDDVDDPVGIEIDDCRRPGRYRIAEELRPTRESSLLRDESTKRSYQTGKELG
jgi:hypothetical protein